MDASQGAQAIIELFAALSNAQVSGEAVQNGQRLLTLLTTLLIAWTGIQMMLEFEPVKLRNCPNRPHCNIVGIRVLYDWYSCRRRDFPGNPNGHEVHCRFCSSPQEQTGISLW